MHFVIGLFKLIWNRLFGNKRRFSVESRRYGSSTILRVVDGDTVTILYNGKEVNARLKHFDAPEMKQTYGRESKAHLEYWIANNQVRVFVYEKDKWGRPLVDLINHKGTSVAHYMISNGYAVPFMTNRSDYIRMGEEARYNKKGMWRHGKETPKEFRSRQRIY